jgi:hypothetical protein
LGSFVAATTIDSTNSPSRFLFSHNESDRASSTFRRQDAVAHQFLRAAFCGVRGGAQRIRK